MFFSLAKFESQAKLIRVKFATLFALASLSAGTITEEFDTLTKFDSSSTAVWNISLGKVHVPFIVDRAADGNDAEDDTVNIGTGIHGAFDSTTYTSFDVNQGVSPTLVTLDTGTTYEFTQFVLDSGVTLKGQGSAPLQIRVQGDAQINGTIDLNGAEGEVLSTDASASPSGGTTCCGGTAGGSGGQNATSADSGDTGKGLSGQSSASAGNGSGGGGGGGNESAPFAATNGNSPAGGGSGGTAGSGYGTIFVDTLVGGSGGGGGASYSVAAPGISSGGGGGGGGGAIKMEVGGDITLSSSGSILVAGGNGGGTSDNTLLGGSGGGGGGGALVLFSGAQLANSGTLNARRGTGGLGSGGGSGGTGAVGRVRLVDSTSGWFNNATPVLEDPVPNMADFGRTFYSKSSYQILSKSFDTQNSSPTYQGIEVSETKPSGSTITYEFSGSSDNFESDETEFFAQDQISSLNGKRYIRFRITLQASDRSQTPEVFSLRILFQENDQAKFSFAIASCASIRMQGKNSVHWKSNAFATLLFLVYLFLIPKLISTRVRRSLSKTSP